MLILEKQQILRKKCNTTDFSNGYPKSTFYFDFLYDLSWFIMYKLWQIKLTCITVVVICKFQRYAMNRYIVHTILVSKWWMGLFY